MIFSRHEAITVALQEARESQLREAAQRQRLMAQVPERRAGRRWLERLAALPRAGRRLLDTANQLRREMAAVDVGDPIPTVRNYPLAPTRQPQP